MQKPPCQQEITKNYILYYMELIINTDGGSRGNPGPGAAGWVIKDLKGKILLKQGLFFPLCTNNYAEFTALQMALEDALKLGANKATVRTDSLLLVKQYSGEYKIKNPDLQEIMKEIKKLASKFSKLAVTHVPREQNKEADQMCNITMDNALKPAKKTSSQPSVQAAAPKIETSAPVKKAVKKEPVQLELFDMADF